MITSGWWQPDTALEFSEACLLRREITGIQKSLGVMYLAPHPKRSPSPGLYTEGFLCSRR